VRPSVTKWPTYDPHLPSAPRCSTYLRRASKKPFTLPNLQAAPPPHTQNQPPRNPNPTPVPYRSLRACLMSYCISGSGECSSKPHAPDLLSCCAVLQGNAQGQKGEALIER
jgi:hypothetical protein